MAKLLSTAAILIAAASSQAFVIDDFSTGSYNSGYFSAGSATGWTASSGALGGNRFTQTAVLANPLGGDARARVVTSAGIYSVGSEAQVDIFSTIGYGFASSSTTPGSNPLNFDMTAKPMVEVIFDSNDVAQPMVVMLTANNGATTLIRTVNIAGGIASGSPVSYFADFTSDLANLGDIDAIQIDFDPAPGGDFALTTVQVVPEPASMAVIGVGLVALARRRRK